MKTRWAGYFWFHHKYYFTEETILYDVGTRKLTVCFLKDKWTIFLLIGKSNGKISDYILNFVY
jgi:hypothetical protein